MGKNDKNPPSIDRTQELSNDVAEAWQGLEKALESTGMTEASAMLVASRIERLVERIVERSPDQQQQTVA